jgi:hypothetical protein
MPEDDVGAGSETNQAQQRPVIQVLKDLQRFSGLHISQVLKTMIPWDIQMFPD